MTTKTKTLTKVNGGSIISPAGFKVAGLHTGVKRKRNDLGIIYCEVPANAAAVYTLNAVQAAPIKVTKESISKEGKLQAIIANSGNANACTGEQGLKDAYDVRHVAAEHFGLDEHLVAVASTGVIGERLPVDKIIPSISKLIPEATADHVLQFNEAILTTDTVEKSTCYQAIIDGKPVTMAGSAKGSGMIEPNMATMLAFLTTDANVDSESLELALKAATNKTFNCITVDGDTSTNDTVMVMASGMAETNNINPEHKDWSVFVQLIQETCEDLAKMIARDGEGATKLIQVDVTGAVDDEQAIKVAKSVVGSSLVKTAIFGKDVNWGRIIAAVGYSGADINPDKIDMSIGPIFLLKNSQPVTYIEEEAVSYLEKDTITIVVDLNNGTGKGTCWGCDLTYDYVRINASYRT